MHGKAQLAEKVRVIFERRLGIAVVPRERLDLGQFSSVERIAGFVARETGAGPAFAPSMLSSTG